MPMPTSLYDFLQPPPAVRGNVTQAVTEVLRRAIVTLELRPGEVLDKNALCARLGVSRFPVSEALARLQAEGLVDIQPQRGSTVSLVRLADVEEYMLIRKALEAEAVRVLVARGAAALLQGLRDNLAAQHAARDREVFHQLDLGFHELLLGGMRFDKLRAMIDTARANLDRARRLSISPRRIAVSAAEHQAVFDAIAAGDAIGATAAMRAHIDSALADVFALARQQPALFAAEHRQPPRDSGFPFG